MGINVTPGNKLEAGQTVKKAWNKQLSHLWQQETYRGGCYWSSTDQRHHTIAVHGTVHLAIGRQHDPRRPEAGLTDGAAAALKASRQEQGTPTTVTLLEGAVLVISEVVLRAHVTHPATEAEQAGTAVPPRWEEGSTDTEQRLIERERDRGREKNRKGIWG